MLAAALSVVMAVSLSACTSGGNAATAAPEAKTEAAKTEKKKGKPRQRRQRLEAEAKEASADVSDKKYSGYLKDPGHGLLGKDVEGRGGGKPLPRA